MRFLALVCVLSLHGRATLVENGGDWMLSELTLWAVFLPLGTRFSVDAVRASLERRRETTVAELGERAAMAPDPATARIVSLAAFTILFQLAVAYFFNAIQKGGPTWRHGTAVHYVLYQNRMVTWLAVWMRPHMTPGLSRVLSYAALATEGALPILILSPFPRVWARRAAVLAVIGLHIGFQCFINLGIFSWTMIAYTPFLLTEADWSLFARLGRRRGRRLVVTLDASCGVCFQLARVLARLDRFGRIRLVAGPAPGPEPAGAAGESPPPAVEVVEETTGGRLIGAEALAALLRALPLGVLWSWPLRLPGLRALANSNTYAAARIAGYYKVFLDTPKVTAELTATARCGFHKYTFPATDQGHIILDLVHAVGNDPVDASVQFENDHTISGYRISDGWGGRRAIYFVMQFYKPFESCGIERNGKREGADVHAAHGRNIKAFVNYQTGDNEPILVKVGISGTGIDGARKNLSAEIPAWDFDQTRGHGGYAMEKNIQCGGD